MNKEILTASGIDYDEGLKRFFGKRELYETVLLIFLRDTVLERAEAAYRDGDVEALFGCAHEMKGASGSAMLTELYRTSVELTELLRGSCSSEDGLPGRSPDAEELSRAFLGFKAAYLRARDGISRASQPEQNT